MKKNFNRCFLFLTFLCFSCKPRSTQNNSILNADVASSAEARYFKDEQDFNLDEMINSDKVNLPTLVDDSNT